VKLIIIVWLSRVKTLDPNASLSKEDLLAKLDLQQQIIADQQATILEMQSQMKQLHTMVFGSRSERWSGAKEPKDTVKSTAKKTDQTPKKEAAKAQKKRKWSGATWQPLPDHLVRKEVILEPQEELSQLQRIGEEVCEKLAYTPGELYVIRYIRPKYAHPTREEKGVMIAPAPQGVIPKGNVDASLLAYLLISKFEDHLPIYRLVKMFKRMGAPLSEGTISGWLQQVWTLLEPLYELVIKEVLQSDYLQADETPIKVLEYGKDKRKKISQAYFWVYRDPLKGNLFFDYRNNRSKGPPKEILKDFQGILQTDGYAAYQHAVEDKQGKVKHVFCNAHARRKFHEAVNNHATLANKALDYYQQCYQIERQIKDEPPNKRLEIRQKEARPIAEEFERWLRQAQENTLESMTIGKAINYTLERWAGLTHYLEDGRLEIDNNLIENKIRPVALGRKNYLFAGSHTGAKRAAMFYTFMALTQVHGVEPMTWLKDVLDNIGTSPMTELHQWLPQNYEAKK